MATLPRFVRLFFHGDAMVCKKYDGVNGFINSSENPDEDVVKPAVKFEVEAAKNKRAAEEGLVHIRSCLNNKYWRKISEKDIWIVAAADKPNEDDSKWDCTLFKPYQVNEGLGLVHVQLAKPLGCAPFAKKGSGYFLRVFSDADPNQLLTCMDWESLVILPPHVTFKGDNGKYLKADVDGGQYLMKFSGDDYADPGVGNQVFHNSDGSISIKNNQYNKFWRMVSDSPFSRVTVDAVDSSKRDTRFWPVKVQRNDPDEKRKKVPGNIIALRCLGDKNNSVFCTRWNSDHILSTSIHNIVKEAKIYVDEQVVSRDIYDITYHLADARIYGKDVMVMATASAINGSQVDNKVDLSFSYTEGKSTTWSVGCSLHYDISASINAGIPFLAGGQIEVSQSMSFSVDWSTTTHTTQTLSTTYQATVPKRTKITVSLVASKATCEVPFSYTQRDVLVDGRVRTVTEDGGVFTGTNCYDFDYEVKEKSMDP